MTEIIVFCVVLFAGACGAFGAETWTGDTGTNASNQIIVGSNTDGTLMVDGGTSISYEGGYIGYNSNAVGTGTVTGAGSVWNDLGSGMLGVGFSGTGTLNIEAGGKVRSASGIVGDNSGATGTVTVRDADSLWDLGDGGTVGFFGTGTVTVENGGTVKNGGHIIIGSNSKSVGTVTVTGAGSVWRNAGNFFVGEKGTGTLIVENGGAAHTFAGLIGYNSGGAGAVTVTGSGSVWSNASHLVVGMSGTGTINIETGGRVENDWGLIGYNSGSTGTVTVSGTGSQWNNSGGLYVGGSDSTAGGGGTLSITNGGTVSAASVTIYSNNVVNLQSSGILAVNGDFDAGQDGDFNFTGGTLSVASNLTRLSVLAADCRLEASDITGDLTVHGTFAPGLSPADTTLDGALALASGGTLEMELGGTLLGTEYDRLTITGPATLDGTLEVVLLDGFDPASGDSFDLFNWAGGRSGTFSVTNLPSLSGSLSWDTSDLYSGGTVTVVPEPAMVLLLGICGIGTWIVLRNKLIS